MKKWTAFLGAVSFLLGCGNLSAPAFKSLIEGQPFVVAINPPEGSALQEPISIQVKFSQRVDIHRLDDRSILLIQGAQDPSLLKDPGNLMDAIDDQQLKTWPLQTFLDGDETSLTLRSDDPLAPDIYYVVITPSLTSVEGIPFSQSPGEKPTPFVAAFTYGEGISLDSQAAGINDGGGSATTFGPPPEELMLNEILYDGLVSETDGEAFVELLGTPGADISLYQILWINGADGQTTDRVTLPTGTLIPDTGIFVIADLKTNSTTQTRVATYNFLDQFDPQNGPDAVQLLDREAKLLDAVVYGQGAVQTSAEGLPLGEGLPALDVSAGHSLSRVEGEDTNNNSVDFVDLSNPTPGMI